MAYDEGLAQRIRELMADEQGVSEKRMFGGIAFLLNGNMSVGVVKDNLMVRVGPDAYERLVRERHTRKMDFTGNPMKGFVYVAPEGLESDADLSRWVAHGLTYARSLPRKGR
jgi:TfoX/Sxy family transcriptional regulator of competence genes